MPSDTQIQTKTEHMTPAITGQLRVGSDLPAFTTVNHLRQAVSDTDMRGAWTVLFFYPSNTGTACQIQVCSHRDAQRDFSLAGIKVYGATTGDVQAAARFAADQRLNYPLLADPDGLVSQRFGVLGGLERPQRTTFIIDPLGKIRAIVSSDEIAEHRAERISARLADLGAPVI